MWNNEEIMKELTDEEAAKISGGSEYVSVTGPCGKPVSLYMGQYCQVRGMYGDVCKRCDYNPQKEK